MPYKDPEENRAYQREYQRKQKAKEKARQGEFLIPDDIDPEELTNIEGIKRILAAHLSLLNIYEAEAIVRAKAIAQLAQVQSRIIETSDLEKRITEIEKTLEERGSGKP